MLTQQYERLIPIKYLFERGIKSMEEPEPFAQFGILQIHDAIEMAFSLACEIKLIDSKKFDFNQYISALKASGLTLSNQAALSKLNSTRVLLKHSGVSPSKADIKYFGAVSREAIVEIFEKAFSADYKCISLADLVPNAEIRKYLKDALGAGNAGKINEARLALVKAFFLYRQIISTESFGSYHRTLLKGKRIESPVGKGRTETRETIPLKKFGDAVSSEFARINELLEWISIGLPPRYLKKIQSLLPRVYKMGDDQWGDGIFTYQKRDITSADLDWVMAFIVELCLEEDFINAKDDEGPKEYDEL